MKYIGSKNRLSKYIVPILQNYIDKYNIDTYIEPFVGGANVIDKIKCKNKIGYDINKYLIALLNYTKNNEINIATITEEEYNKVKNNKDKYSDWYVGLVGFCATFGSKYFGGYARVKNNNRDMPSEGIHNIKKQAPNLKDCKFIHNNFLDIDINNLNNCVIYCDPPYKGTTKYKTEKFPYDKYYKWVRKLSKNNIVICSEYNMPDDFICIWQKETKVNFDSNRKSNENKNKRIEKLFIYKDLYNKLLKLNEN